MIIGFKKSKNKIGHYHPIFKYQDDCGGIRTYTRAKSMEITPFTMDKNYIICKKEFETYEMSERQLSPRVYFLALRILFLIIAFINPKIAALTVVANFSIRFGYEIAKIIEKYKLKKNKSSMSCVGGKIIGYREVQNKSPINDGQYKYRPMIEYLYKGEEYVHIGSAVCGENQRAVGALCKVYINSKKKMVIDEFELDAPIITTPKLSTKAIQKTYERILARTKRIENERARRKEAKKENAAVNEQLDLGMSPLRLICCDRAANWY